MESISMICGISYMKKEPLHYTYLSNSITPKPITIKQIYKITMASSGEAFPAADLEKELHPGANKEFVVDSVSSAVDATKKNEQEQREMAARKEKETKDALQSLKRTIIISGIVVAVAGAVFAITRKIREK